MMDWNSNWGNDMAGWMWLWMGLWSLLVIAGIIALVVLAMRATSSKQGRDAMASPLDLSKRGHGPGELDDEESEQRRKRMGS